LRGFDQSRQQNVRVPFPPGLDVTLGKPDSFQDLNQFRGRQEVQTFHRLVVTHARGKSFPALDAAMFRAFRAGGVAQNQSSAGAQGPAGFS
jgi:hypothetical protein